MLRDEAMHKPAESAISTAELMSRDCSGATVLHNTMRFDVKLSHVHFNHEGVDTEEVAKAIRAAIVQAVDDSLGTGFDGVAIAGWALVTPEPNSAMLHRETISFDFS